MRRGRARVSALLAALALLSAPVAALANGPAPRLYVGGLKLVWGALPVPNFGGAGAFGVGSLSDPPPGFAMSLTLPDEPRQSFIFSPRLPQLGLDSGATSAGQRAYLGFSFDMGQQTGLYGNLGLGGSVAINRAPTFQDLSPRSLDAPLLLHGGLEFGYRPDPQNSVSLSIEQATPTAGLDRGDSVSSVRLRYGLKF